MKSRFGGKAVRSLGRGDLSLIEERPPSLSCYAVENRRPFEPACSRLARRASPLARTGTAAEAILTQEEADEQAD
jgi:hypothetical protein